MEARTLLLLGIIQLMVITKHKQYGFIVQHNEAAFEVASSFTIL